MQQRTILGTNDWAYAVSRGPAACRVYFEQHLDELNAVCDHGHTPLGYAAHDGDRETVALLLDMGARLTPEAAIVLGMESTVSSMLAADPTLAKSLRVEGRNFPLLWFASIIGNLDIAALLLCHDADVNAEHPNRVTPLHGAAMFGRVPMIHWLIGHGARVNATSRYGLSPLHEAALRGRQEAAAVLLAHGADVNARTLDGETAVNRALQGGHTALVQWFKSQGARD